RVIAGETLVGDDKPHESLNLLQSTVNGHYYALVSDTITWYNARSAAEELEFRGVQGHLVTITSDAEQTFLTESFLYPMPTDVQFHIGLTDWKAEGDHTWITGEPFEYIVHQDRLNRWLAGRMAIWPGVRQWVPPWLEDPVIVFDDGQIVLAGIASIASVTGVNSGSWAAAPLAPARAHSTAAAIVMRNPRSDVRFRMLIYRPPMTSA
ncbi:MAG: hypothetical protein IIA44_08035, partial [Acidobacteria bacterium]|nr:hypothetical protein [Acidobacteriota bacterium]